MTTEGAERLRAWRTAEGITQAELADRLGVTQGAVSHLESETLPGLAMALRIEVLTSIEPSAWGRMAKRRKSV